MQSERKKDKKGIIFVISGPSGSGKTTLIKRLLEIGVFKNNLTRITTCTTRPMRKGERNKKDYIFLSRHDFKQKIKRKEFLEWQKVLGAYYGTPLLPVQKNLSLGKDIILCIDVKGARVLRKEKANRFVYIFIIPSDKHWRQALWARLKGRLSETEQAIKKRLKLAEEEIKQAKHYDYKVINQHIKQAVAELAGIIIKERAKGEAICRKCR